MAHFGSMLHNVLQSRSGSAIYAKVLALQNALMNAQHIVDFRPDIKSAVPDKSVAGNNHNLGIAQSMSNLSQYSRRFKTSEEHETRIA